MTALRARLAYERPETAGRLQKIAAELGLLVQGSFEVRAPGALSNLNESQLLLLEQLEPTEVVGPRVYSLAGANPDLLIVVVFPQCSADIDACVLRNGAFDVVHDGPELKAQLTHTVSAAARVVALQEERARLNSELAHQDKLSALGVLAAGVSHEINNPCSAALANITFLRDEIEAVMARPRFQRGDALEAHVSDWSETLGDCVAAINRIRGIVKTLNVFSRKTDSAPSPVDLNEEIRTVLRLIGKEVRFRAQFEMSLVPGIPKILAPPNAVTQVVTNLVVNALQALEGQQSDKPMVWIGTDFDDDHIMLEIGDNGPGIPTSNLSRVFDPFFTTKPVGMGTGLGLSITRQLVQRIGGEIFVESEPGRGAKFSVVIERSAALIEMPRAEFNMPPASDRLRVLLLDDDELILRSMQRSLSPHFECTGIARARLALDTLRVDRDFDVVVSDVVMPEMNGIEFFSALTSTHPELANRTLFISGGITSGILHEQVTETGRPCLAKPVDMQELVRTIRRVGRPFEELGH